MASIQVKYRPSKDSEREGSIYYQIIHQRKVRQLSTNYHILRHEWSKRRSSLVAPAGPRYRVIISLKEKIRSEMKRLSKIVRRFDELDLPYSIDDVVDEFRLHMKKYSLFNYMTAIIETLAEKGRVRTAETYQATLNSFRKFRRNEDIMLDCISSETMESYESWLLDRGLMRNTTSFYMRVLRAVYNRAVKDGVIDNLFPFRKVYTGIGKTDKRALPLPVIKDISSLKLSPTPALDYARDMFMLSFFLRGMSFVDMAFLKKSDLKNGVVTYRRRKTGTQLRIKWTKEMQTTVDKYPENKSDYLLPIICEAGANPRGTYLHKSCLINSNLKKLAARMGLNVNLTLYVARHSWASAAHSEGIPLSVISQGMGHGSESTTRIYLTSLDPSVVDRANSRILNLLH